MTFPARGRTKENDRFRKRRSSGFFPLNCRPVFGIIVPGTRLRTDGETKHNIRKRRGTDARRKETDSMGFDLNQAQELLNRGISEAQGIIQDPSKVDELLIQLEEKLKTVPVVGETLADIPLMIAMIKAWIKKEYTVVSPKVIACLVGGIIYLLNRKDLIPDSIPLIGITDDLAVMALALKLSEPELKAFSEWRMSRGVQA